jgi:hypothetical protein
MPLPGAAARFLLLAVWLAGPGDGGSLCSQRCVRGAGALSGCRAPRPLSPSFLYRGALRLAGGAGQGAEGGGEDATASAEEGDSTDRSDDSGDVVGVPGPAGGAKMVDVTLNGTFGLNVEQQKMMRNMVVPCRAPCCGRMARAHRPHTHARAVQSTQARCARVCRRTRSHATRWARAHGHTRTGASGAPAARWHFSASRPR